MMRRLFAVAAVMLMSGLLPLAASAGVCVAKPCCHAKKSVRLASAPPSCCGSNAEAAAARAEATVAKTTTHQPQVAVAAIVVPHVAAAMTRSETSARIDTGPPSTRQRLATLSTLLI